MSQFAIYVAMSREDEGHDLVELIKRLSPSEVIDKISVAHFNNPGIMLGALNEHRLNSDNVVVISGLVFSRVDEGAVLYAELRRVGIGCFIYTSTPEAPAAASIEPEHLLTKKDNASRTMAAETVIAYVREKLAIRA